MNELILKAQQALNPLFSELDEIEAINTQRVLDAFQEERISSQHFAPSLGYGYDDIIWLHADKNVEKSEMLAFFAENHSRG